MDASVFNPYDFFITQSQSNRWLKSVAAASIKEVKLTLMEWLLMMAIRENNHSLTVTEAAELLGVSLPQITALSQTLVVRGAVQQKVISTDRRSRELILTKAGEALCKRSEKAIQTGIIESTKRPNPFLRYCQLLRRVVKLADQQ